jgi:hypothetical protein
MSVQPFDTLWRRHTPKSNFAWYVTKLCLLPIRLVGWAGESAMSPIVYNLGPGSIPLPREDGGDTLPVVTRRRVKQPACIAWSLYAVRLDDSEPRRTPAWYERRCRRHEWANEQNRTHGLTKPPNHHLHPRALSHIQKLAQPPPPPQHTPAPSLHQDTLQNTPSSSRGPH